jgi:hypothetical protein
MHAPTIVGIRECGYLATWGLTPSELRRITELRAEVFSRELGWVGSDSSPAAITSGVGTSRSDARGGPGPVHPA